MENLPVVIIDPSVTFLIHNLEMLPFVASADDYEQANAHRRTAKQLLKALDNERKKLTKPLDDQKKAIMSFCRPLEAAIEKNDAHHVALMMEWDRAMQAKRDEEQRKLNEYQAKKAADEKAALEAKAIEAMQAGKDHVAEVLIVKAEEVKPVEMVLAPAKPEAQGVHYMTTWGFEILDANLIPREFLLVDEAKLRKYAVAMKEDASVPGVKFIAKKTLVSR